FPQSPNSWVLTGGGCHNNALVKNLSNILSGDVVSADEIGWSGDAMEAQAFAYLAVRSIKGLAISFPGTTGVTQPISGGTRFNPAGKKN
ncbi:MAG: anhydro-N-acetylmuramic acid kinase, partial [Rhodospirillaceae bacterium]|nr:anhydro-N-acetylmuramic acid kinase [Rhodospirillaceae bacterium]